MSSTLFALLEARGIPFQQQVSMANKTTLRVGGPAYCWVDAHAAGDIRAALMAAKEAGKEAYIVGNGSNLLVRDGGIDGLVIHIGQGMEAIQVDGTFVRTGAGARLSQVAVAAQEKGLSGMEAISGIPGTIGGALCMNAGSYGVEIGQLVQSVEAMDMDGNIHILTRDEMAFAYRRSTLLQQGWIATAATLSLVPGDPVAIRDEMRRLAAERRAKQPLSLPSAGSFFKRPQGHFAGALIEQAGLKGFQLGGARVSEMHAGFLVNMGGASARDFLDLSALIQARVYEISGVTLEAEVRILGCDLSC